MKRGKKVINYMDVPVKKRGRTAVVQAYRITESSRGFVSTTRIGHLSNNVDETISDVQHVYDHEGTQAFTDGYNDPDDGPFRTQLYQTKNKGRGSIHVR